MSIDLSLHIVRFVSTTLWALVVGVHIGATVRAFTRHARNLDPVWAVFCGCGISSLVFAGNRILTGHQITPQYAGLTVAGHGIAILMATAMIAMPLWYSSKP